MTKFILIGGYPFKAKDNGKSLCYEMIKEFDEQVKILICLFARSKEKWDELYEENKKQIIKNLSDYDILFELADESTFLDQIIKCDILFFSGGDTSLLLKTLEQAKDWQNKLDGKTVVTSSASTDMVSKYNYDLEFFKCSDGLGLVPVKTVVHFGNEEYTPPEGWEKALERLKKYKEGLPIWTLHEGEYKVYISNYC